MRGTCDDMTTPVVSLQAIAVRLQRFGLRETATRLYLLLNG